MLGFAHQPNLHYTHETRLMLCILHHSIIQSKRTPNNRLTNSSQSIDTLTASSDLPKQAKLISLAVKRVNHGEKKNPQESFYARRAVGGDCDHRHLSRAAASGSAGGT